MSVGKLFILPGFGRRFFVLAGREQITTSGLLEVRIAQPQAVYKVKIRIHLSALGFCNDILIGNAFASEEEFKALSVMNLNKITMKVDLDEKVSDIEKEIVVCASHASRDDCNEWVVRSSSPRDLYKDEAIAPRKNKRTVFKKGDIIIVNDNLKHYAGELMIVLKEIGATDEYNYVGHLDEGEQLILDCIRPKYSFDIQIR